MTCILYLFSKNPVYILPFYTLLLEYFLIMWSKNGYLTAYRKTYPPRNYMQHASQLLACYELHKTILRKDLFNIQLLATYK
jgi:hypothetical protein